MTPLTIISRDMTEQEYHQHPAMSYSAIHRYLDDGFQALEHLNDPISSPSLTFGSLVDVMITRPQDAYKEFVVATIDPPSDKLVEIVNRIITFAYETGNIERSLPYMCSEYRQVVGEILDDVVYYNNWSLDKRIDKVCNECNNYYEFARNAYGKTVITQDVFDNAQQCVRAIYDHPLASQVFGDRVPEGVDRYYQLKLFTKIGDVEYKIMPDCVLANHDTKEIGIWDLKTMSMPEYMFPKNYIKYSYWIQQWVYEYVMGCIIAKTKELSEYDDYKVKWKGFVVVSKTTLRPTLFNFDLQKDYPHPDHLSFMGTTCNVCNPFEVGEEISDYLNRQSVEPNWIQRNQVNNMNDVIEATMDYTTN